MSKSEVKPKMEKKEEDVRSIAFKFVEVINAARAVTRRTYALPYELRSQVVV